MKSNKITVNGIVQRVGYRNKIYRIAKELDIKGYVKNLDDSDESVEILAQHKNTDVLEEFIKKINIKDSLVTVQKIDVKEAEAQEYKKFEIVRADYDTENAERLDVAAQHLEELTKITYQGFNGVENKLDEFNQSTQKRFDHLDVKYGKVSDKLEKISNSLEKLVGILEGFKSR